MPLPTPPSMRVERKGVSPLLFWTAASPAAAGILIVIYLAVMKLLN
jgi:hypothetical protein